MRSPPIPLVIATLFSVLGAACSDEGPPTVAPTMTSSPSGVGATSTTTLRDASGEPPASAEPRGTVVTTTGSTPTTSVADPPIAVLIGAGDIADDGDGDSATARLIESHPDALVFTTGDNAYEDGTAAQFAEYYEPTWGAFKDRTKPTIGNHDKHTEGAAGYFDYFGAAAGSPGEGWYSYDLGPWHVIHLNSDCGDDGLAPCKQQMQWLRDDLSSTPAQCMIAIWHKPLFNSGVHENEESFADEWALLDEAGADVVLNGHDHNYQRYARQDSDGHPTPTGMREFVVGTGGADPYEQTSTLPNLEQFYEGHGVLELELRERTYSWRFIPTDGTYSDTGQETCTDG